MLERLTGGRFVSAPHRVFNHSGRERLSFPFFYDPDFTAQMNPLPGTVVQPLRRERWDGADLQKYEGSYGEYLSAKVARVFPTLS